MHELSITQSMLEVALEQAEKAEAKEIKKINVVIGAMTGIVEQCVQFYFKLLGKGTIAEEAALSFTRVSTTARCRKCGKHFEVEEFAWVCPYCGVNDLEITAGKELFVESIEVE